MQRMNSVHKQGETLIGKALSGVAFAAVRSAPTHSERSLLHAGGAAINIKVQSDTLVAAIAESLEELQCMKCASKR
ncbi:hypothetical protein R69927_00835 [Paraburkholderia domus]|jgi:hypothetical protein|uniref:Uncharacterized protein n=1 Tax=Paraburkholderia domus TaxID=2793075 RepID=A0A9N8MLW5_9BURK|nr:hypothetical protein R70006_02471 [Paraburkholderia domus]CAE6773127.1 hypothetical protein R69749_01336 [Paraburkholderia domus]CAE6825017.1 hypothetical protein R69927_00835 [Paraburkholderia domus]CAE6857450.1 hypothetical protein R70199_00668 [Paraburkholderia domus]CAE6868486.1 hypothetical protein R70211_01012 [Paraburkholderia domus]